MPEHLKGVYVRPFLSARFKMWLSSSLEMLQGLSLSLGLLPNRPPRALLLRHR